jgi:hypothetical protein
MEEASVLISFEHHTEFPSLLPTGSSGQNQLTEGIPAKDTKTDLAGGEIPSFLKQIKKVNHEFAIIFKLWEGEVGAFPDLGGSAEGLQASGQIGSIIVSQGVFVPSSDGGWEKGGV